uniref:DnaJ homolog subfamily C member 10 n=1 Tax=Stichopus japonicus TaxID=307972 RepID=A0A6M2VJS8_STIJA|nr:DNAJC10 [Apostichopus japonicus]
MGSYNPFRLILVSLLCLMIAVVLSTVNSSEDFYELLGIERDATTKDIRRAFKKIALSEHPDKNPDDPKAHEKFVKINRAYEVLKDDDLRKKYDRFGEEGLKEDGQGQWNRYESWQFYKTEFGLYDEDPEVVTLSKTDFEQSVFGEDIWLVNFYSPRCHHCHDLAPTWREFAKEMEGVIRIGAVNCWDDRPLCTQQGVQRFPSLIQYPSREHYNGARKLKDLVRHALRQVKATVHSIWTGNFKAVLLDPEKKDQPWVISYCTAEKEREGDSVGERLGCLDSDDTLKLAAILNKAVHVGSVDCIASKSLCEKLKIEESTVMYYPSGSKLQSKQKQMLEFDESKQIAKEVLRLLPALTTLTTEQLQLARENLKKKDPAQRPLVVYFITGSSEPDNELRKLPKLVPQFKVALFNCSTDATLCDQLYLTNHLPKVTFFRVGGEHEFHHGRSFAADIAAFARESFQSLVHVLDPSSFPSPVTDGQNIWLVDFFSPHCSPCLQLIPEIHKVAKQLGDVEFGTVDCTIHKEICSQQQIRSYPTMILFNNSKPHHSVGYMHSSQIMEFIEDILNPKVVTLDSDLFTTLIVQRSKDELWLVDFFAPWCGPCQQLAPEWRRVAKRLNGTARLGSVDCVEHQQLCSSQSVSGYPTIRAYPVGKTGSSMYSTYNGWFRNVQSLVGWAYQLLPSSVTIITKQNFRDKVLRSEDPWVVDFYAPWCGPCQAYMPNFEEIAKTMKDHVRAGKVDCQAHASICQQASITGYPSVRIYKGTTTKGYSQNWYGEGVQNIYPNFLIPHLKQKFPNKLQEFSTKTVKDEL